MTYKCFLDNTRHTFAAHVFDVKTSTELSILAARLRFGSKFYRDTLTRIASEEAAIVMLDGKSVTRLETTLNELTVNRGGS